MLHQPKNQPWNHSSCAAQAKLVKGSKVQIYKTKRKRCMSRLLLIFFIQSPWPVPKTLLSRYQRNIAKLCASLIYACDDDCTYPALWLGDHCKLLLSWRYMCDSEMNFIRTKSIFLLATLLIIDIDALACQGDQVMTKLFTNSGAVESLYIEQYVIGY